jgi:hypothetical protein
MAQMPETKSDSSILASHDLQFYYDYFEELFRSNFFKCLGEPGKKYFFW